MLLTVKEQRKILRDLPVSTKNKCKMHCRKEQQSGKGISDILKSIGNVLGPIVKTLGPTVLKNFIVPFLEKKMRGEGLRLAGDYRPRTTIKIKKNQTNRKYN